MKNNNILKNVYRRGVTHILGCHLVTFFPIWVKSKAPLAVVSRKSIYQKIHIGITSVYGIPFKCNENTVKLNKGYFNEK